MSDEQRELQHLRVTRQEAVDEVFRLLEGLDNLSRMRGPNDERLTDVGMANYARDLLAVSPADTTEGTG